MPLTNLGKLVNFGGNALLSNGPRLSFPYKLTLVVTYWCNYRCKTCNIWERRPKDELTLAEIQAFFRSSSKFNWIDFTGGEVWLRKDFVEIVEAAMTSCPNLYAVHFPTNGFMTDRIVEGVRRIVALQPPKLTITVSTDGDEAVNDMVRGIPGGWRHQIETFKRLSEMPGVDVFLGMTLSSFNADQYDRAFAAAQRECPWLTGRHMHVDVAHESAHYYGNAGLVPIQDRGAMAKELGRQLERRKPSLNPINWPIDWMERRYLKHARTYLQTGTTPMRYHALRSSCFVDSWGSVYPCGMYDHQIANLRDHAFNLESIWNLPETLRLQQEIWNYKCPQCWTPCEANQSLLGNLMGLRNR